MTGLTVETFQGYGYGTLEDGTRGEPCGDDNKAVATDASEERLVGEEGTRNRRKRASLFCLK